MKEQVYRQEGRSAALPADLKLENRQKVLEAFRYGGDTIRNEETKQVNLVALCKSIGVSRVVVCDPFDLKAFEAVVKEEVNALEPSVIIAQRPCALLKTVKYTGHCEITDKCKKCKLCMKLGCPAISVTDNCVKIDATQCNGCGLCLNVCPFDAIKKVD